MSTYKAHETLISTLLGPYALEIKPTYHRYALEIKPTYHMYALES